MKIDMSGIWNEPELLGRSRKLKQHSRVGRSGVAIVRAAHDEDWAVHFRNVIDRMQLRRRNTNPPMQLRQKERRERPADRPEIILHPIARCDFDCRIRPTRE